MDGLLNLCSVPLAFISNTFATVRQRSRRIRWKNVSILFSGIFLAIFLFRYFNPKTTYYKGTPQIALEDEKYRTVLIDLLREWPSTVSDSDAWRNIPEELTSSIQSLDKFSNSINKWNPLFATITKILVVSSGISSQFQQLNDIRFSIAKQSLNSVELLYQNLLFLQKKIHSRRWCEKYVMYPLFSRNSATYPAILDREFITNVTFTLDHTMGHIPHLLEHSQSDFKDHATGMLTLISAFQKEWPKNAVPGWSSDIQETPLKELKAVSTRAVEVLDNADKTYKELDAKLQELYKIDYVGRDRFMDRQVDDLVERFGDVRNGLRRVVYGSETLEVTGADTSTWNLALSFDAFGCTVQSSIKC